MGDAVGKIIEMLLEGFKKNYKRPKMWLCIGIIVFCFVLLFPYIDSNFFYFSRIEKRIDILEKVMALDETKINSNQAYMNEYQDILQEIEQQSDRSINLVVNKASNYINHSIAVGKEQGNRWIKFFTGAFWAIIITIWIPFMDTFKKRSDKLLGIILMMIISIALGWFFSVIPIIITPMFNYIGIPVLQVILVVCIVCKSKKKK